MKLLSCNSSTYLSHLSGDKAPAPVAETSTPQKVRLVNMDPLPLLSADKVQQNEEEILNLTRSMATCRDSSMRAVLLCRRGALLRKVKLIDSEFSFRN